MINTPPQTIAGKHAHHYWIIHSCWSEWWRSERKVKHAHHVKLRFASSFRQLQLISLQSSSHGIRLNVWMNELTWNWRCKPPTKAGSLQFCFFCFFWWRNAPISWHFRNLVTYGSKSPHVTGTSHAFFFNRRLQQRFPQSRIRCSDSAWAWEPSCWVDRHRPEVS